MADPSNAVAEVNDVGKIPRFVGDVWLDHACCVVTMKEELTEGNPDVAQAAMNAVAQPLPAIDRALTSRRRRSRRPVHSGRRMLAGAGAPVGQASSAR